MARCRVMRRWTRGLGRAFTPSPVAWRGAALGLYALWTFMVLWAFGISVLPHFSVENALGEVALYGYLALAGAGLWLIVSLVDRLEPPYRSVLFLVLPTVGLFAALIWEQGAPPVLLVLLGGISLLFGAAASLFARRAFMTGSTAWLLTGVAVCGLGIHALLAPVGQLNPALAGFHLQGRTLALPNPGERGAYSVMAFSYGSQPGNILPIPTCLISRSTIAFTRDTENNLRFLRRTASAASRRILSSSPMDRWRCYRHGWLNPGPRN